MNTLKNIWNWLVRSSDDYSKTSLTVKAFLTALVPVAIGVLNLTHFQVSNVEITSIVDDVSTIVFYGLGFISAVAGAFGLLRKVYTTAVGTNDVINSL